MLIDSHVHLQLKPLCDDIPGVLARASAAGVGELWCCATVDSEFEPVIKISREHENVLPFIGVHPWMVKNAGPGWRDEFTSLLRENSDVNVGEIGLDRWVKGWENTADMQEEFFRFQLSAANEFDRAAQIHCIRAWGWLMDTMRSCELPRRFILHSYAGPAEMIDEFVAMGAYFTFSGTLLGLSRHNVHAAAVTVPAERLLIETDSPDLPIPGYERPNQPQNLPVILNALAQRRGISPAELEKILQRNARRFIGGGDE